MITDTQSEPIFLVGSERSGTTLLRLMLDHHPQLAFNLESEYMVTQISDRGEFPDMNAYRDFLFTDRVFAHSQFGIDESLDYKALLNDFLNQKKVRDGKQKVGATIHYHFWKLARVWPRAKYIYLYRDGRDVASSVMKMGWAGNLYLAADVWLEAEKEWDVLKQGLPDECWLEVQYEKLTTMPETELQKICSFLGLSFSERMFDYVRHSSYQMPDPELNYQWKTRLKTTELQMLEEKIADTLLQRGYELSGLERLFFSGFRKSQLAMDSRIRQFLVRVRRYGWELVLGQAVCKRLRMSSAYKRLLKRMNQIDDLHIR